jgi:hypothetical protein
MLILIINLILFLLPFLNTNIYVNFSPSSFFFLVCSDFSVSDCIFENCRDYVYYGGLIFFLFFCGGVFFFACVCVQVCSSSEVPSINLTSPTPHSEISQQDTTVHMVVFYMWIPRVIIISHANDASSPPALAHITVGCCISTLPLPTLSLPDVALKTTEPQIMDTMYIRPLLLAFPHYQLNHAPPLHRQRVSCVPIQVDLFPSQPALKI